MPSPKVKNKQPKGMTFTEALGLICDGQKVTRKQWKNKNEYGLLHDDKLCIHTKGRLHTWIVSFADIVAEDWKIV